MNLTTFISTNKIQKQAELYRGKTKTLYSTENPDLLILEFRDDISAEDGLRIEKYDHKGMINNKFNYFIMCRLSKLGIPTQMESMLSDTECLVKNLKMIPIECVIRNYAAGSLLKRLNIKEGTKLNPPLFDLFLKSDTMHDPIINDSYCETFNLVNKKNLKFIKDITYEINKVLIELFNSIELILIDFKLEFGVFQNEIILGDEFTLDSSRLWDKNTLNKMDKDCFRQNLGNLIEVYKTVASRIGII